MTFLTFPIIGSYGKFDFGLVDLTTVKFANGCNPRFGIWLEMGVSARNASGRQTFYHLNIYFGSISVFLKAFSLFGRTNRTDFCLFSIAGRKSAGVIDDDEDGNQRNEYFNNDEDENDEDDEEGHEGDGKRNKKSASDCQ